MSKILGTALLLAVLVLTTACSGADSPVGALAAPTNPPPIAAGDAQRVTVTVGNAMRFEPSSLTVRVGQPVEVTLRNTGSVSHDFALGEGTGQPIRIAASAGQSVTDTFTIDKPGNYTFVCSVPGHASAGMRGAIVAQ